MKALVTGGTGFVGRYLVDNLLASGHGCRLLVRVSSDVSGFKGEEGIELWQGDLTEPSTLDDIAEGVDYVFHLAAEGHVSAVSEEAFKRFVQINVEGTKNLLHKCKGVGIRKFVHFSSTAAMGLIKKPIVSETDEPEPVTPYQKSKLKSETEAIRLGQELGIPVCVVRPCMIYGIGGKGEFYKICRLMRKGRFPRVGRGKNLTPLVHVNDVVQAAIKAAEHGRAGEAYLIASERSLPLDEMRDMIMAAWGEKAMYPYVPVWLMMSAAYMFEVLARLTGRAPVVTRRNIASTVWDMEFSIEKAKNELGYVQQVDFFSSIMETVRWYKTFNS